MTIQIKNKNNKANYGVQFPKPYKETDTYSTLRLLTPPSAKNEKVYTKGSGTRKVKFIDV